MSPEGIAPNSRQRLGRPRGERDRCSPGKGRAEVGMSAEPQSRGIRNEDRSSGSRGRGLTDSRSTDNDHQNRCHTTLG